jgi:hypothetical protein
MAFKKRMRAKIFSRWPMALIVIGIVLTVVWLVLLIWFPLHLLEIV